MQWQNLLLLAVSYFFYGCWDARFLSLLAISTLVDFFVARKLEVSTKLLHRRLLLFISLSVNLGLLLYFKYFNFFIENFVDVFRFFGHSFSPNVLRIVLPVGISFYTFQTLSYSLDVFKKKIPVERNIWRFAAFVSFFPQLVAGPIERASNLLPQFSKQRKFTYALGVLGLRLILWGLFKKVVVADNCSVLVDTVFADPSAYSSGMLIVGAILFSIQIYCDFSGYSDIAIGTAKLFGFHLMVNFRFPYFSRDIAEFWRRWHISLSTWFRDYVYIPLGGSRVTKALIIRNTIIVFLVSGFWHGANWTFIIWGGIHALLFIPVLLLNSNRKNLHFSENLAPKEALLEGLKMLVTFSIVTIAWIFFRADDLQSALNFIQEILVFRNNGIHVKYVGFYGFLISILFSVEWLARFDNFALEKLPDRLPRVLRWLLYIVLLASVFAYLGTEQQFIYFQF